MTGMENVSRIIRIAQRMLLWVKPMQLENEQRLATPSARKTPPANLSDLNIASLIKSHQLIMFQPDEINKIPRLVSIGDIHGTLDGFKETLLKASLIDDKSNWIGGNAVLVQHGDVIDRGPDSVGAFHFLQELQYQARAAGGKVIRLFGNHELMLLEGDTRYVNFPNYKDLATELISDINSGKVKAAYAFGNRLFTHAGLRSRNRELVMEEISKEKNIAKDNISIEDITERLNWLLIDAVNNNRFNHPIFQAGYSRGGKQPVGGIVWCDFQDEAMQSVNMSMVRQVLAHSPDRADGEVRYSDSVGRINVDVGMAKAYGGGRGYLEIVDNKITAHFKRCRSEWQEKTLGYFMEDLGS